MPDNERLITLIQRLDDKIVEAGTQGGGTTSDIFLRGLSTLAKELDNDHLGTWVHDDPNVNHLGSIAMLCAAWLGCIPKSKLYAPSEERPELSSDEVRLGLDTWLKSIARSIETAYAVGRSTARRLRESRHQPVYDDWEDKLQALIRGHEVSVSAIKRAAKRGQREGRIPAIGGTRKNYAEIDGIRVPVKWLIREATGMHHSEFGLNDAIRVVLRLGFPVKKLGSNS